MYLEGGPQPFHHLPSCIQYRLAVALTASAAPCWTPIGVDTRACRSKAHQRQGQWTLIGGQQSTQASNSRLLHLQVGGNGVDGGQGKGKGEAGACEVPTTAGWRQ
jgi:hypothetical protein